MKRKRTASSKLNKVFYIETEEEIEQAVREFREHLRKLRKSGAKRSKVMASKYTRSKSYEQLELFHGAILDHFHEAEPELSKDAWKLVLKAKHLSRPLTDEDGVVEIHPETKEVLTEIPSLSKLKIDEMSKFIENCKKTYFDFFYVEMNLIPNSQKKIKYA